MAKGLTYNLGTTNREDLLDIVVNISPTATPILSSIPHKSANGTYHEWSTDRLKTPGENAIVEGADATYPALQDRQRLGNYCQIFENAFSVSETQRVVAKAGIDDEYAYQATKAIKEHALDTEYAIINNDTTGDAGSASSPRKLKGMKAFIDSSNWVDAGGGALETSHLDDAIEKAWVAGGEPTVIFCSAKAKRRITAASGAVAQRTVPGSEHREIQRTDVYEGELGTLQIRPHRQIANSATAANNFLFVLDMNYWRFDYLRRPKEEELAKTGDAKNGHIISEGTLVGLAPAANSYIHNFTT